MIDQHLESFCNELKHQAKRRQQLYDGYNNATGFDKDDFKLITAMVEELGEIASAIIRERPEAAKAECIDLAHCCFLLYCKLSNKLESDQ